MEQAIASWLATEVLGVSVGTWITAALVVNGVVEGRRAAAALEAERNKAPDYSDHTVAIRATDAPRTLVYGRTRVGGVITYGKVHGDHDEFLTFIVTLAGTEIDAIEDVWFDDVSLGALDGSGYVQTGNKYFKDIDAVSTIDSTPAVTAPLAYIAIPATAVQVMSVVEFLASDPSIFVELVDATDYQYWGAGSLQIKRTANAVFGGGATFFRTTYRYNVGRPLVKVRKFLGSDAGERDTDLESISGGEWTAAHVGKGIARVKIQVEFDPSIFGTNGLPAVSCIVRGRKCYDYSTGLTVWTENTILQAADYITHPYGFACNVAEINSDYALAAQLNAAELVPTGRVAPNDYQTRYASGGVLSLDQEPRANLEKLLNACIGSAVWTMGQWVLRAGVAESAVGTLEDNDLAMGEITVTPSLRRMELFNGIHGTFNDAASYYKPNPFTPYLSSAYVADDNAEEIYVSVDYPMVQDDLRCQRLAKASVQRARQSLVINANWQLSAYWYQPGDVVKLRLSAYGWDTMNGGTGKDFRILSRSLSLDGKIAMTMQEESTNWDDWLSSEGSLHNASPDTDFPDPSYVRMIAGVAFHSGANYVTTQADGSIVARVEVSWDEITDSAVLQNGRLEWRWKPAHAQTWQAADVTDVANVRRVSFTPVYSGLTINVACTVVNNAGGRSALFTATYVCDSSIPANATGAANLVVNAGMAFDMNGWHEWKEDTSAPQNYATMPTGITGNPRAMLLYQNGTAQKWYENYTDEMSIEPGSRYAIGLRGIGVRCDGLVIVQVLDAGHNVIGYKQGNVIAGSAAPDASNEANYVLSSVMFDAESAARFVRLIAAKKPTTTGLGYADSGFVFFKPQVSRVLPGQTVFPDWAPGVQGAVDTVQIALGATYETHLLEPTAGLLPMAIPHGASGLVLIQSQQALGPWAVDVLAIVNPVCDLTYSVAPSVPVPTLGPQLTLFWTNSWTVYPTENISDYAPAGETQSTQYKYASIIKKPIIIPAGKQLIVSYSIVPWLADCVVNSAHILVEISKNR